MPNCERCGAPLNEKSGVCARCAVLPEDSRPPIRDGRERQDFYSPEAAREVRFCLKCGARLPDSCVYCLICGTKAGETPLPEQLNEDGFVQFPEAGYRAAAAGKYHKKLIVVGISLCMLLVLAALGVWLSIALPYLRAPGGRAGGALVYTTQDGSLRFISPFTKTPYELASGFSVAGDTVATAKTSADGRRIAWLGGYASIAGRLFLCDFGKTSVLDPGEAAAVMIAENVTSSFFFTDNSAYLVYLDADGDLFANDFTSAWKLDGGVLNILDCNGGKILYTKASVGFEDSLVDVYTRLIEENALQPAPFATEVSVLADWTSDLSRFVYMTGRPGNEGDIVTCDLEDFSFRTVATGADGLIAADAETFTVMYQTAADNPFKYESLINDDLASRDRRIKEPDLADYPMLADFYENYGEDGNYSDSMDYEELVEESNSFEEDVDAYLEKLDRDGLRQEINAAVAGFAADHPKLYSLHLYQNGATSRLAGDSYQSFGSATLDAKRGLAVWSHMDLKNFKRLRLSQYKQTLGDTATREYLNGLMSESLYIQQFGYSPVLLNVSGNNYYSIGWQLSEQGDGVFFALGYGSPLQEQPANKGLLYYAPVQNGVRGTTVLIDEEVCGVGQVMSGGRLLYYKDMVGGLCDLYVFDGRAHECVASDILLGSDYFKITNSGKTALVCGNYNSNASAGDLFMLAKQNRQLASDVHRFYYRNDSLVYFLRVYHNGVGDLYVFDSNGLSVVDTGVTAVLE